MSIKGKLWGGAANEAEKGVVRAMGELTGYGKAALLGTSGSDRVEINDDKVSICSTSGILRGAAEADEKHEAVKERLTEAGVKFHDAGSFTDTLVTGISTNRLEVSIAENGGHEALTAKLHEAAEALGPQEKAGSFAANEAARRASGQGQSQGRGG